MNLERHPGMFKPGQSGNPLGRPKTDQTIRDLARAYTEGALLTLVEIAANPTASDSARVQAASALLDRGWGKPMQQNANINCSLSYLDFLETLSFREDDRTKDLLS